MALIECPECGAKISDTAKQCVQCGYQFVVCPECKKILSGGTQRCDGCGYEFIPQKKEESQEISLQSVKTKDDYFEAWKSTSTIGRNAEKILKFTKIGLGLLEILLFIIAVIQFFSWQSGADLEKVMNTKSTVDSISMILIFAGIVWGLQAIVQDVVPIFNSCAYSNWLERYKVDTLIGLKKYENATTIEENLYCDAFVTASFMKDYSPIKTSYIVSVVIDGLIQMLAWIFFAVFILENVEFYMLKVIVLEMDFSFQYTYLIAFGVAIAFWFAVSSIFDSIHKKKESAWLEKIYPGFDKIRKERIGKIVGGK